MDPIIEGEVIHQKSKLWTILGIVAVLALSIFIYIYWSNHRALTDAEREAILKNYEAYSLSSPSSPKEIAERAAILKILQKEAPTEPTPLLEQKLNVLRNLSE